MAEKIKHSKSNKDVEEDIIDIKFSFKYHI